MHNTIDKTHERFLYLKEKGYYPKSIVDIGANLGQFHNLVKSIYPDSKVLSVEGNPECENALRYNNPNYLITLLGSEKTTKTFYVNKNDATCTGASIYKETTEFYDDCNEFTLPMTTLDSLQQTFDLIKIDVQGAELDILKGGVKTIVDCDFILVELSINKYNDGAPSADEVIVFLSNLGFQINDIFSHFYFNNTLTQIDILFINTSKKLGL